MLSILNIVLLIFPIIITIFSGIIFFSNMDYFDSVDSSANIVLTFIVLVLLTAFAIKATVKESKREVKISILVICMLFLLVPLRAMVVTANFNPINDLSVQLVDYETEYKHSQYTTKVELQFTTTTYERLSGGEGELLFYDGNELVAKYPIKFGTVTNTNRNFYRYEFKEDIPMIYNINYSSLSIYCSIDTLRFSDDLNSKYSYDPITVRLK